MRYGVFIFLIVLSISSCKENTARKSKIDEGIITYNVSYFASEKENPIVALLPNKVELKFKNNNISLTSEGYLGFFSTRFVSLHKNEVSHILLKVLNNKFYYEFPKDEIAFIYNQLPPVEIKLLKATKTIAGYECNIAELYFQEDCTTPVTIAYTNDIGLADPNRNTPLHKIDGVLMEFETTMNQVKTKFTAQTVCLEKICDEEFLIPEDYVLSDLKTLQKYIVDFK